MDPAKLVSGAWRSYNARRLKLHGFIGTPTDDGTCTVLVEVVNLGRESMQVTDAVACRYEGSRSYFFYRRESLAVAVRLGELSVEARPPCEVKPNFTVRFRAMVPVAELEGVTHAGIVTGRRRPMSVPFERG